MSFKLWVICMVMWISLCLLACFVGVARCPPGLLDHHLNTSLLDQLKKGVMDKLNNGLLHQLNNGLLHQLDKGLLKKLIKGLLDQLSKGPWNQLSKNHSSINKCSTDLSHFRHSITKEIWAMKMIDAFGKLESGLLEGEIIWIGKYDECLDVLAPAGADSTGFKGQFCWINLNPTLKVQQQILLKIGSCFPNSCDGEELTKNYNELTSFLGRIPIFKNVFQELNLASITCVQECREWSTSAIVYMTLSGLLISIVIVATATDLLQKKWAKKSADYEHESDKEGDSKKVLVQVPNNSADLVNSDEEDNNHPLIPLSKRRVRESFSNSCTKILLCFSAAKSSSSILDMKKKSGEVNCLHGIRFLSITWVILSHSFMETYYMSGNPSTVAKVQTEFTFQAMIKARFAVDSFFLLSGFLLGYVHLKGDKLPKNIGGWIYFYAHRYFRLTPAYVLVLSFWATLGNCLGSGPFWDRLSNGCYKAWWMNLLYINNFQNGSAQCMGHTWYLAVDMQFFIISPLFLLSLKRWPIIGIFLSTCTILASSISSYFISYTNDLTISNYGVRTLDALDKMSKSMEKYYRIMYVQPYCRIGPYLIGIVLAYFILRARNGKQFGNKWISILGWTSSTACGLWLVYGSYYLDNGVEMNLFVAFSNSSWALCVGWVIYACVSGYGDLVNDFLSMKYFLPLSRLTYSVYLVHFLIMNWYYCTLKELLYFNLTNVSVLYLAFLLLSFGVAFVCSVLVEMPFVSLEKQLIRKK